MHLLLEFHQVAVVIGHNLKRGALHHFFMRIAYRKGKMAAITATARKIAVIVWHMMTKKAPYTYMKEEDYLMGIRIKQINSLKRKIKMLNVQPHELTIGLAVR